MTREEFLKLYNTDCSAHIEKKDCGNGRELSYLSWAWAWAEFAAVHPDATYEVVKFDGLPYLSDASMGIIVYTRVTVGELTREMWLPVMDSSNKAMKLESYSYRVYDRYKKQYVDKYVAAADMFDINKTIMRCLTKNLAMFGMGLSIYAGEDVPQPLTAEEEEAVKQNFEAQQQKKSRKKAAAAPEPQQQTQQQNDTQNALLTVEMFQQGKLQACVDWLVKRYDATAATIPAAACDKLRTSYQWEDGAFDAVVTAAQKAAFSQDLNS